MTLPLHGFTDWQTSLRTADLSSLEDTQVVNPGNTYASTNFDMRAYSSYSIKFDAKSVAAATAFIPITITLSWTSDANFTLPVFFENYQILGDGNGSVGFPNVLGRFMLQDAVHGPYLRFLAFNGGVDAITVKVTILGNSRSLGRRYVQNTVDNTAFSGNQDAGQLLSLNTALGVGASVGAIIPLSPGPISMRQQAVTAPMVMQLLAPDGSSIQGWNIAAGVESHTNAYLPRMACRAVATNGGGVGGTAVWEISSGRDNW